MSALLSLAAAASTDLAAQGPAGLRPVADSGSTPHRVSIPASIRYGKWITLGGSVGTAVLGTQKHHDANVAFRSLQKNCREVPEGCQIINGHYLFPANEALYQRTRDLDHQAARYLAGAEVLFAASATGFVWELMHHQARPKNIPFEPRVARESDRTEVGLSVAF